MFEIYTDGATSGNGKENAPGGFAFAVFRDGKEIFHAWHHEDNTTNQRCEMRAIICALDWIDRNYAITDREEYIVYSDSAYCINCCNEKWYARWQTNGWLNSKKQPVANKDLWEHLIPYFEGGRVRFEKIKGHSTNERNNLVDSLAVYAKTHSDGDAWEAEV